MEDFREDVKQPAKPPPYQRRSLLKEAPTPVKPPAPKTATPVKAPIQRAVAAATSAIVAAVAAHKEGEEDSKKEMDTTSEKKQEQQQQQQEKEPEEEEEEKKAPKKRKAAASIKVKKQPKKKKRAVESKVPMASPVAADDPIPGKSEKMPMRHRHTVLKGNIGRPALRRLARRGGVKRISEEIYEAARESVKKDLLEPVIRDAIILALHAGRKTVTLDDALRSLKRNDAETWGMDIKHAPHTFQQAKKKPPTTAAEPAAAAAAVVAA